MPENNEQVSAVSLKLPTFWTTNAAAWFAQAEAQFGIKGIVNDQTRYWYVVAALDSASAKRAAPILQDPPNADKYKALKDFLVGAYELSDNERAKRLLAITELGDRRPSELMDTILSLNGSHPKHFLLRQIFLNALPVMARSTLATSAQEDLRALALEADRIVVASSSASTISSVVDEVDEDVCAAMFRRKPKRELCFYHQRFGKKATQCRKPCDWVPSGPPAGQQGNSRVNPRP